MGSSEHEELERFGERKLRYRENMGGIWGRENIIRKYCIKNKFSMKKTKLNKKEVMPDAGNLPIIL